MLLGRKQAWMLDSLSMAPRGVCHYSAAMAVDVRWQQRAESFAKAVSLLRAALSNGPDSLNDLEKEGTVQRFEFTVELA
jgi:hypothetical protein